MHGVFLRRRQMLRHLGAALWGLAALGASVAASAQQQLTVSAAASLSNVLKELGSRYETSHPGIKLQFNFAASGVLIQQIAQGAPVDIFISADEETMARGIAQKLLDPRSRRDIASNQVVLVAPIGSGAPAVTGLASLNSAAVQRIAIGKLATVPVGRYTRQALETAKLWDAVTPKLVYADSVRQVLDYVARGEVDAGFVYATDAALMPDKVRRVQQVEGHAPVRYPAALTQDGTNKTPAGQFLDYLLSTPAQDVLAKAGFGKP